jgi:putative acetyltransferase
VISDGLIIREIRDLDNAQLARVIRSVLEEHEVPQVGTTYADPILDSLYEYYNRPRAGYYVVEQNGIVMGGAGITGLEDHEGNVCELQKMYFLKDLRGSGIGSRMLHRCLELAINQGYECCYLETMPYMKKAQQLYLKNGFEYLEGPMGNTGHYSCTVWMLKKLSQTNIG